MDLEFTDDQLELRRAAAAILDRYSPLALARGYLEGRPDRGDLWDRVSEFGWLGVGAEPDDGFGVPGLCLLAEQVGRHVAPFSHIDTVVAARVALAAQSQWADKLTSGLAACALAMLEPDSSWLAGSATKARRRGDGTIVLRGTKVGVHHAASAEVIAVVCDYEGLRSLAFVRPGQPGLVISALDGLDPSCAPGRVDLENVQLKEDDLLAGPQAEAALATALDLAAVASTAEALGAASEALEMAIAYSHDREQFGRPIGSFQSLQHLVAEHHVMRETAWSTIWYAAEALEEASGEATMACAVAKSHGAATAKAVTEAALQVLGGIGFTREHDFHLLYRRALECSYRFGSAEEYEQRVAAMVLA